MKKNLGKKAAFLSLSILILLTMASTALSQSITGRWRVTAGGLENWEISMINNQVVIVAYTATVPGVPLPGDRRERLSVESFKRNGTNYHIVIRRWTSVKIEYFLTQVRSDRIEGTVRSEDRNLCDLGMVQPPECIVYSTDRVVMIKLP